MKRILIIFVLSIWLLPGVIIVNGQDDTTLYLNTLVDGNISDIQPDEVWTFHAFKDDILSLRVDAADEEFDPILTIRNSNGIVISNDDYAYPDNSSSLLEAITIPRTDTYEVEITGFGGSVGAYQLMILPGYANLIADERFVSLGNWETDNIPLLSIEDGALVVSLVGVKERGILSDTQSAVVSDFYAGVSIRSVMGRNGWVVGLVLRQQENGDGYVLLLDARGFWSFSIIEDGVERIIRDWSPHPAILENAESFELAALVNGNSFEMFYNRQFLGRVVVDSTFDEGRIGLAVQTADALDSNLTAMFDELLVTVPLLVNERTVFPQRIVRGNANVIAKELERRQIIPAGGQLAWSIEDVFVETPKPGVGRVQLLNSSMFGNYAIATTFTPDVSETNTFGCGLLLRQINDTDYMIAYLDNTGAFGVSQRRGDSFEQGIYGEGISWDIASQSNLLVVVDDDVLNYYINFVHVGTMEIEPLEGAVGNVVVSFGPVDATCRFSETWMWSW
jgi:hypothetical protein